MKFTFDKKSHQPPENLWLAVAVFLFFIALCAINRAFTYGAL